MSQNLLHSLQCFREGLPRVLDVSFGEDQSRIRKGNAQQNIGVIRKSVLNLLRPAKEKMPRQSIRRMRKLAGRDEDFLHSVLTGKF